MRLHILPFKRNVEFDQGKADFLAWLFHKNSEQRCGPYCPKEKCPAYSDEKYLGRKCYYGPQCWRGFADAIEDMKHLDEEMPGPTVPNLLSAGSSPASGLPLTAVEDVASHNVSRVPPTKLHGDHNDKAEVSTSFPSALSSSELDTPTNTSAGDAPTSPAQLSPADALCAEFFAEDAKGFPVLEKQLEDCGCPICIEALRIAGRRV